MLSKTMTLTLRDFSPNVFQCRSRRIGMEEPKAILAFAVTLVESCRKLRSIDGSLVSFAKLFTWLASPSCAGNVTPPCLHRWNFIYRYF